MCETECRLFLALPGEYDLKIVSDCLKVAIEAGDVASLLLPNSSEELSAIAKQASDAEIAVLLDCSSCQPQAQRGDGVQLPGGADYYRRTRAIIGNEMIIGAACGNNRHLAMELAEAGADYIGFSDIEWPQNDESIIKWWSDLFEIPSVVLDGVTGDDAMRAVADGADFICPDIAMWQSPQKALSVVTELMKAMKAK